MASARPNTFLLRNKEKADFNQYWYNFALASKVEQIAPDNRIVQLKPNNFETSNAHQVFAADDCRIRRRRARAGWRHRAVCILVDAVHLFFARHRRGQAKLGLV